jgi:hypothetical protein
MEGDECRLLAGRETGETTNTPPRGTLHALLTEESLALSRHGSQQQAQTMDTDTNYDTSPSAWPITTEHDNNKQSAETTKTTGYDNNNTGVTSALDSDDDAQMESALFQLDSSDNAEQVNIGCRSFLSDHVDDNSFRNLRDRSNR